MTTLKSKSLSSELSTGSPYNQPDKQALQKLPVINSPEAALKTILPRLKGWNPTDASSYKGKEIKGTVFDTFDQEKAPVNLITSKNDKKPIAKTSHAVMVANITINGLPETAVKPGKQEVVNAQYDEGFNILKKKVENRETEFIVFSGVKNVPVDTLKKIPGLESVDFTSQNSVQLNREKILAAVKKNPANDKTIADAVKTYEIFNLAVTNKIPVFKSANYDADRLGTKSTDKQFDLLELITHPYFVRTADTDANGKPHESNMETVAAYGNTGRFTPGQVSEKGFTLDNQNGAKLDIPVDWSSMPAKVSLDVVGAYGSSSLANAITANNTLKAVILRDKQQRENTAPKLVNK